MGPTLVQHVRLFKQSLSLSFTICERAAQTRHADALARTGAMARLSLGSLAPSRAFLNFCVMGREDASRHLRRPPCLQP